MFTLKHEMCDVCGEKGYPFFNIISDRFSFTFTGEDLKDVILDKEIHFSTQSSNGPPSFLRIKYMKNTLYCYSEMDAGTLEFKIKLTSDEFNSLVTCFQKAVDIQKKCQ